MLIAFDLDGTLVDSRRDLAHSANELLEGLGLSPLATERITAMVGNGAPVLVERVCRAAGLDPVPADAIDRFLTIYDTHLLDHTRAYVGVPELIRRLVADHTLAVLTNKPLAASTRILEGLGLLRTFAAIVAGDGPHPRKPDPAGLHSLAVVAPEQPVLLVGDSAVDRDTAQAGHVPFCLARYGFGWDDDVLKTSQFVIDRPVDLLDVVGSIPG